MKIAFIYDTAYPWNTGGAERRIYEIATRLARDHDVHIYSLGHWMDSEEYRNQENIKYNNISYHSVGKPMELYTQNNTRSIKEALYFAMCILRTNLSGYDIIDCQGFPYFSCYSSWARTLMNKSKLVITVHEVWNDYWYDYLGSLGIFGKIVEKGIFHLTPNVVCVSKLTQKNMLMNHDPGNKMIIANGVDTSIIKRLDASKEHFNVIYAGRFIPEKHVDLLIKSISIVREDYPDISCLIVGEGPTRDCLGDLVVEFGLEDNITFRDFYEEQFELYFNMKNCDVFVLPSIREGFGIVVIEANCCGSPVITIDSPMNAAKDLIGSDNGWVVRDDVEALARCISSIMANGISSTQRKRCMEFASSYDWDNITSKTLGYYKDIMYD
ncbi:MAG: glycosyltransferase family 4 protein [Methanosphaera sp.]|nr:glycosyltransferase family 4 protein [Methanosphaera sp.]